MSRNARVTFKGSECGHVGTVPVLIEISVPRARLPAIRSRHFPLKTTETVVEGRPGWGSFRNAIYHGVLFLDVSRDPISTDNGTPQQSARRKNTCAHYLNARHRALRTRGERNALHLPAGHFSIREPINF